MDIKRATIPVVFIFFICFHLLAEDKQGEPAIDIDADYMEYLQGKRFLKAEGNVRVNYKDMDLTARRVTIDLDQDILFAEYDVVMKDGYGEYHADTFRYNIETETGTLVNFTTYLDPWVLRSRYAYKVSEKEFILKKGIFTTCDKEGAHWKLASGKMRLIQEDRISGYHSFLYFGKIPCLYFPYFTESLTGSDKGWSLDLGYNKYQGYYAKFRYRRSLSKTAKGTYYIDRFSRKGWGLGFRYSHFLQDIRYGYIFGYRIREKDTGIEKWMGEVQHWHQLSNKLNLQMDAEFLSHQIFSWDYQRQDSFLYEYRPTYLKSRLALTHSTNSSNLRLYGYHYSEEVNGKFEPRDVYAPGLSLNLFPRPLFSTPVNWSLFMDSKNRYKYEEDEFSLASQGDLKFQATQRLSRRHTLSPEIGLGGLFEENSEGEAHYFTRLNLNSSLSRVFKTDLGHYFYKSNRLEDSNILSAAAMMYSRPYRFRFSLSRDLLNNRFLPFIARFDYRSRKSLYYYSEYHYDAEDMKTILWDNEIQLGRADPGYVRLRTVYLSSAPGDWDTTASAGVDLGKKWILELRKRIVLDAVKDDIRPEEDSISIKRNLHCWDGTFTWSKKRGDDIAPGREEFWLTFSLNVRPSNRIGLYRNIEEESWQFSPK